MATHVAFLSATLLLGAALAQATEPSTLVRVTTYWREEGQLRAASNGAHLRNGHCAVDPKKIPYGSRIILADEELIAVDTGPAVVSRKAARASGRNRAEKEALVIDHYFETKSQAVAWEKSHPHFMPVQILAPGKARELANNAPLRARAASPKTVPDPSFVPQRAPPLATFWSANTTPGGTTTSLLPLSGTPADVLRFARRRTGGDLPVVALRRGAGPLERLRLSWLRIG